MRYYFKFVPNLGCLVLAGIPRFPDAPEAGANIPDSGRQLPMYHYAYWSYGHSLNSCRWLPMYHYARFIAPTGVGGYQCITTLWA